MSSIQIFAFVVGVGAVWPVILILLLCCSHVFRHAADGRQQLQETRPRSTRIN